MDPILFLLITLCSFAFYHFYYKRRNLPPGPIPLPFVGNMMEVRRCTRVQDDVFLRWRRQYGPVFTYWAGNAPVVCVADYRTMVDTFVRDGDAYADRKLDPSSDETHLLFSDKYGIFFTNDDTWREHRRFMQQVWREFGAGRSLMQEQILDELGTMFAKIDAQLAEEGPDAEVNLPDLVDLAAVSIFNKLLFGYRMDKENERFELRQLFEEVVGSCYSPLLLLLCRVPRFLWRLPPFSGALQRLRRKHERILDFIEQRIRQRQQHLNEVDGDSAPECYVDAFLAEAKKRQMAEGGNSFSIEQLRWMCYDLWVAGNFATSISVGWAIAYMLHNQENVRRMNREMAAAIGGHRMVTVADRQQLPYTNAVVHEALRTAFLLTLNPNRATARDIRLHGYTVPKGTHVVAQFTALFSDEKIFENAAEFIPERYLDADGRFKARQEMIPFAIGKRQCPGEAQARMELFLFIANIFNRYQILPGKSLPSLDRAMGIFMPNPPFTCRLHKLQQI